MIIKEYRIPLPMTVEEYRIAQLYMIQVSPGGGWTRLSWIGPSLHYWVLPVDMDYYWCL